MPELERRACPVKLECREAEGAPSLRGYAVVFNSLSVDLGGFTERIAPGAVKYEGRDVYAFRDHEPGKVLGRTTSGTLELRTDEHGVAVNIMPPDTPLGHETMELVRRGDLGDMSFAFTTNTDVWETDEEGNAVRTLIDVDLHEVSVVTWPAYPDTSVAVRSYDAWASSAKAVEAEQMEHQRRMATRRRRLRLAEAT